MVARTRSVVVQRVKGSGDLDRMSRSWVRRSERTSGAVERAGCEREPQSGRELDERLHGWPFCGDGGVVSEQGQPKAGHTSRERESRTLRTESLRIGAVDRLPK